MREWEPVVRDEKTPPWEGGPGALDDDDDDGGGAAAGAPHGDAASALAGASAAAARELAPEEELANEAMREVIEEGRGERDTPGERPEWAEHRHDRVDIHAAASSSR